MSGEVMTFPNTWEEYEEQYGFNDTEQVYTNGSRLIQSFRVKQWLEHIEVSEDCISKAYLEQEIEREVLSDIEPDIHYGWNWALNKVAEIIRNAPSVALLQDDVVMERLDKEDDKC